MSAFEKMKFCYGTLDDYNRLKDNTKLENYFYYLDCGNSKYQLYLNTQLIYDSNFSPETITNSVIESSAMDNLLSNYIKKDASGEGVTFSDSLKVVKNSETVFEVNKDGKINSSNLQYADDTFTTDNLKINNNFSVGENFAVSNDNITTINKAIINAKKLSFDENAEINADNLKIEVKNNEGKILYRYDFETGNFTINTLTVNSITGLDNLIKQLNNITMKVNELQIGSLKLSDDNGNLKITTVSDNAE